MTGVEPPAYSRLVLKTTIVQLDTVQDSKPHLPHNVLVKSLALLILKTITFKLMLLTSQDVLIHLLSSICKLVARSRVLIS